MLEIHEIRALVIKHLTDEVTEAEMRQLEEWASLSTENRIWLQRFFDINWVAARIVKYRSFDPEENRENMWARITSRQKEKTRLNRKFRRVSRVVKVAVLFAGIAWPVLESRFQIVTPSTNTAQVHRTNANQRHPNNTNK